MGGVDDGVDFFFFVRALLQFCTVGLVIRLTANNKHKRLQQFRTTAIRTKIAWSGYLSFQIQNLNNILFLSKSFKITCPHRYEFMIAFKRLAHIVAEAGFLSGPLP